ncbi:MAG: transketolase-like TK C-terminal-containing protein [Clostridia bacterium]
MKIIQKSYNTLRVLSAEMIANSQVGDVRSCLVCAPTMFLLFKDFYNFFGGKDHINRDRFVLADVGLTPLYYSLLHLFGINFSLDDLKNFGDNTAQTSPTPNMDAVGVDAGITSKGQGIPTAVGLAISAQSLAAKFNAQKFNVISHYTYCLASTSNLQEGVSQEAMSLAGSLKLSKLILLCNYIEEQADGEKLQKKYRAMGWNVITLKSAANFFAINFALKRAKLSLKPTLILLVNNLKKQFPDITERLVSRNQVEKLKADLGFNGAYKVDNNVRQYCARTSRRLRVEYNKWEKKVVLYRNTHPQLSEELNNFFVKPKSPFNKQLRAKVAAAQNLSDANKIIVEELKEAQKCLMVASIKERLLPLSSQAEIRVFSKKNYRVQNLVFGNREGAMAEICAGVSLYFGAPTWVYAPICLLGQMLGGIEHSAQNKLPVLFCFYQNGSCAQQQKTNIEVYGQFEWLRTLEGVDIYQPATPEEIFACYERIFDRAKPACLVLAQQDFDALNTSADNAAKGAYVFNQSQNPAFTIVASGREFHLAVKVAAQLEKSGEAVKLVSAPSWTIFDEQPEKYKISVLNSQSENIFLLGRTLAKNVFIGFGPHIKYINVNDFTSNSEEITPELVSAIKKEIVK